MRSRSVIGTIGWLLLLFCWSLLAPIGVGLVYSEPFVDLLLSYGLPMLATLLLGLLFWHYGKDVVETVREGEAFLAVGFGWLLIAFLGSLPFIFSGTLTNPIDAYFESMSGFCTCGATVIAPPATGDYLDHYSHSIFFWRALTQWLGGLGIVVLFVVILAKVVGSGLAIFRAEVAGHEVTRIKPKLQQTARLLWGIYCLFTGISIFLLIMAGMNPFDAICHAFAAIATGGFSTHAASAAYWNSPAVEFVLAGTIFVGSLNFILLYSFIRGNYKSIDKDQELRLYVLIILAATALVTFNVLSVYKYDLGQAFRYGSFQVISMVGTCGMTTYEFSGVSATAIYWPVAAQFILLFLMLLGGCTGSTAGAIKIGRILVLLKVIRREIHKVIHPRAIIPIKLGKQALSEPAVAKIGAFFFIYMMTFLVCSMFLMLLDPALDIPEAISAVASCMGGVGPGLGSVNVHMANVTYGGKMLLALCMWIGRLEIFSALILFFPTSYKR